MAFSNITRETVVSPTLRLKRRLGGGGMGTVWIAEHRALHIDVAVKFLDSMLADTHDGRVRFSREATSAAQVKSPHVVQIFDHGITDDGVPFIVMEFLEGEDLGKYLKKRNSLPPHDVATILSQLAKALGRAHELGIIHRDLKPANIFLCRDADDDIFVKLVDFGIAKTTPTTAPSSSPSAAPTEHTQTGQIMGTPYYMSPEQVVGARTIDHRADLWSLGVLAYQALTGSRPFDAETVGGLFIAIHSSPIPFPSHIKPELGRAIDEWFLRACKRDPAARFQSAKELAESFRAAVARCSNVAGATSLTKLAAAAPARTTDHPQQHHPQSPLMLLSSSPPPPPPPPPLLPLLSPSQPPQQSLLISQHTIQPSPPADETTTSHLTLWLVGIASLLGVLSISIGIITAARKHTIDDEHQQAPLIAAAPPPPPPAPASAPPPPAAAVDDPPVAATTTSSISTKTSASPAQGQPSATTTMTTTTTTTKPPRATSKPTPTPKPRDPDVF